MIAGRYEIIRALGRGAFGHTMMARDTRSGRDVTLKALDVQRTADWKAFELFEREAQVLRTLRHHGIPEVIEVVRDRWNDKDTAFLVLEYIEGTPLEQLIAEGRHLDPAAVNHLMLELLGILEYLHSRVPPVLHRDIKPANIIVRPDGMPALVDFGAVRNAFRPPGESGSTIVGTYGYMPYEQYMGQASPASDLFALGATMLHLVTGRPPPEFMNQEGRIEVPESLAGDPRWRPLLERLLRPSPAERFQSAAQARQALLEPASTAVAASRRAPHALLPAGPRELEGSTRDLFERVAPSAWELMSSSTKASGEGMSILDVLSFVFFSVITAGVLPVVFFSMAADRKRRLKMFFREGVETAATIISMDLEETAFGEKLMRVRYEFDADGRRHRDSDVVLPIMANRWETGEEVRILYLADRDYDSVIIGFNQGG